MGLIQNIKKFFYGFALKREVESKKNIDRQMINIDRAKSIGILFDSTNAENSIIVTQFAQTLSKNGKKVHMLGYQDSKSKTPLGEHFFDQNELNWYQKPSGIKVESFRNLKLDILICAFIGSCHPLEYIAATSQAKFRVGAFSKSNTECFELMINIKDKLDLKYLLQQVSHFLKVINRNA